MGGSRFPVAAARRRGMLGGMADVTRILDAIEAGDPTAAAELLPLVYDELRKLAAARLAAEKPGQTLQATALVHEAYLRLVGADRGSQRGRPRALLRRRRRGHAPHPRRDTPAARRRCKHGGGPAASRLDDIEPAVAAAGRPTTCSPWTRPSTGSRPPRRGRAELVKLRYFAGLTLPEAAELLGRLAVHGRGRLGVRQGLAEARRWTKGLKIRRGFRRPTAH